MKLADGAILVQVWVVCSDSGILLFSDNFFAPQFSEWRDQCDGHSCQ